LQSSLQRLAELEEALQVGSLLLVASRKGVADLCINPARQAMGDELWPVQMESLDMECPRLGQAT